MSATRAFTQARMFHELIGGVLDELKLHEGYATKLDIDLDEVKPSAATSIYTDFLLRVAWHDSLAETVAAMVPCLKLYTFLGAELSSCQRPEHPYEQWISTYSQDEFKELCSQLEMLLNEVASDTPAVRDAYRYAMQCELAFFAESLENMP